MASEVAALQKKLETADIVASENAMNASMSSANAELVDDLRSQLDRVVSTSTMSLAVANNEVTSLRSQLDRVITTSTMSLAVANNEKEVAHSVAECLREKISSLEEQVSDEILKGEAMDQVCDDLKSKNEKLTEELTEARLEAVSSNSDLIAKHEELVKAHAEVVKANADFTATTADLEKVNTERAQEIDSLNTKLVGLEKVNAERAEEIESLNAKLAEVAALWKEMQGDVDNSELMRELVEKTTELANKTARVSLLEEEVRTARGANLEKSEGRFDRPQYNSSFVTRFARR